MSPLIGSKDNGTGLRKLAVSFKCGTWAVSKVFESVGCPQDKPDAVLQSVEGGYLATAPGRPDESGHSPWTCGGRYFVYEVTDLDR